MEPTNLERWSRIQELFHSALEREPTGRPAFLAAACGDDASLRMEVEALLAADDKASGFLVRERPAAILEPGTSLGPYHILGLIGRGGMGEVYRARDTRLEREVAIKVLPRPVSTELAQQLESNRQEAGDGPPAAGRDNQKVGISPHPDPLPEGEGIGGPKSTLLFQGAHRDALAAFQEVFERDARMLSRFEREALLTASVQHPAVVPIYERGELPDGRPFYAMKLVSGRSLHELIGERKTLADRMVLLPNVIAVAEALAHAHWQRVVHRDVKPTNVIVGEFGETVLIDWGLAKSLEQHSEEAPLATTHSASEKTSLGEIIGTPAYMSPEQAKGLPVDERSDVFSLGAMLYQVLTGRPPYEGTTPTILSEVKEGHYPPLNRTHPEVPTELAAIVGKAMAPEPAQRYPTARELAEDLRRFQTGQLVLSHRYSTGELLWRWAKRHRTILLASAVFLALALVAGAFGLRKIVAERDRANREAEASNRVSQFMTEMFRVSDPSEARGNNITAREILDKASKQIEGGPRLDPAVQARLMLTMAQVYSSLGLFAKARPLAEKAIELRRKLLGPEHPDTLQAMNTLGNVARRQGRNAEAVEIHRQVLEIRRRVLGPEDPETLWSMNNVAVAEANQGRNAEAEKIYRQVVDIRRRTLGLQHRDTLFSMNNLGVSLMRQGKFAESEKLYGEIFDIQRRLLGPDHPETLRSMNNIAVTAAGQGRFVTAEKMQRQVVEIRRRVFGAEHPETLRATNNLADDERALGRYSEAEELYRTVIEGQRRVLGPDHSDRPESMAGLGTLYFVMRRYPESEKIRQKVLELSRRILGPEHPQTLSCMKDLAELESALGRQADAEKLCREALDIQRRVLGPEHPDTLLSTIALANIWSRQGRSGESEKLQLETLATSRRVLGPDHPYVGLSLYSLGSLALKEGDQKKALNYLHQAVDHGLTPSDRIQMQQDEELKPLRSDPEFETLLRIAQ